MAYKFLVLSSTSASALLTKVYKRFMIKAIPNTREEKEEKRERKIKIMNTTNNYYFNGSVILIVRMRSLHNGCLKWRALKKLQFSMMRPSFCAPFS